MLHIKSTAFRVKQMLELRKTEKKPQHFQKINTKLNYNKHFINGKKDT